MAVGVMGSETAITAIALPEDLRKWYAAELRRDNQADNREILVALNTLEVRVKELEEKVNGTSDRRE